MAGRSRTCAASRFRRPLYRAELRPRVNGRGWTRTSSLLFVRQALSAVELLALELRDKDSNLDLRVQSAVSWPLDDPGKEFRMSRRVCDAAMLFKPLAYASTLDRHGVTAVARHRGGVLEPGARAAPEMRRQKPLLLGQRHLPLRSGEDLSLSGGASSVFHVFFS